ncbi:MAG: heparinase II/III family protein [Rhodobacteraceae bacterium]|nr:heparinase II/III family protein [Paracoccaceae bacterium]
MPKPDSPNKKQSWRKVRLSGLRLAPRSFLHHPEARRIGSYNRGEHLMTGRFDIEGCSSASSIWDAAAPESLFIKRAHNFGWLDDLVAVGDGPARKFAQRWLMEWIRQYGQNDIIAWHPARVGQRVVSWCSHAIYLLQGQPPKASSAIFKSLGLQTAFLHRNWKVAPQGLAQIDALTGMIYAGLSLEGCEYALRPAIQGLEKICISLISPEGTIPSRNPEELAEIFARLTWVGKLLESTGYPANPTLEDALLRMAPGLRALRLGDGGLARFHGGGRSATGRLDQSFADAGIRKAVPVSSFMGYERLAAGRLVLVMDCTAPPQSPGAHQSTLSMEISTGRWPLLVHCGPAAEWPSPWREACARPEAHNNLTIEGHGPTPASPRIERAQDAGAQWLSAVTDGFSSRFGVQYERRVLLSTDGRQISGEDRLTPDTPLPENPHLADILSRPARGHTFFLHFHLHPEVVAHKGNDHIALTLPDGESWVFCQNGGIVELEGSVFLDQNSRMPHMTKQIVVTGRTIDYAGAIRWRFTKA